MFPDTEAVKELLSRRRAEIEGAHRSGTSGFATCSALTASMDDAICSILQVMTDEVVGRIAVLTPQ